MGFEIKLALCSNSLSLQGKFYELYELDAEIGHKELDWKITLSGVGKCRQVNEFWLHIIITLIFSVHFLLFISWICNKLFPYGQVGISESGIDDAVQKLVARG